MSITAKVIADSIANGVRLTTMQIRAHRFILPEINTHRMFSRNFSSSRAIPVQKMLEQVRNDPAIPVYWGKNKAGMQADIEVDDETILDCIADWKQDAIRIAHIAEQYHDYGLHKQIVNRLIEPFQWVNGVVTATEWDNFFALRDHPAAQPEIQALARAMRRAMDESEPDELEAREWHLPYVRSEEFDLPLYNEFPIDVLQKISAARCARVSYNKHDGTNPSIEDDLELYNQLITRPYTDKRGFVYTADDPIHASPCEHICSPMGSGVINGEWIDGVTHMDREGNLWSGNLRGWLQYRQLL